ncbi:hypothetical protein M422DRAFT_261554 [Sphaerobolus stellatus SS14]|uniref:Uncharacterized protein n=1 Tax=Sphaerobolus stellatus (strain SS14) TaxID=990650 RepID=A0A0C9VEI4_SPHS4|nr:hypothetical protein M422DRAFT_261554 [Sphaerobolus stellatus SS14]
MVFILIDDLDIWGSRQYGRSWTNQIGVPGAHKGTLTTWTYNATRAPEDDQPELRYTFPGDSIQIFGRPTPNLLLDYALDDRSNLTRSVLDTRPRLPEITPGQSSLIWSVGSLQPRPHTLFLLPGSNPSNPSSPLVIDYLLYMPYDDYPTSAGDLVLFDDRDEHPNYPAI